YSYSNQELYLHAVLEDIIPGYYMNKKHWNSIKVNGSISDQLLKDMLDEAYELVLSSFSKKRQLEILSL
ncbi:MmcQ/YjbR family DNA-binding protein, partial [Thomasclavelia ramosa]|uniref:MmcQ/YjbR family DNA-binding protein n=1 Tax=Thomasclavelia ramosa TaxID=1547 RepID=UPI001C2C9916